MRVGNQNVDAVGPANQTAGSNPGNRRKTESGKGRGQFLFKVHLGKFDSSTNHLMFVTPVASDGWRRFFMIEHDFAIFSMA